MIIAYKEENGRVVKRIVHKNNLPRPRGEERPVRHFSETLLKGYYSLECEQGSRFQSKYRKETIKRVHDTALARFDETGAET